MDVRERERGDAARLEDLIDAEANAKQRDRYRAAFLALQSQETEEIMRMLRRSRGFVQRWAYAYRDGGIEALVPGKPKGRPVILGRQRSRRSWPGSTRGPPRPTGCARSPATTPGASWKTSSRPGTPTRARDACCTGWGTRRCGRDHATSGTTRR